MNNDGDLFKHNSSLTLTVVFPSLLGTLQYTVWAQNAAMLFYCQTPEMFCGLKNFGALKTERCAVQYRNKKDLRHLITCIHVF